MKKYKILKESDYSRDWESLEEALTYPDVGKLNTVALFGSTKLDDVGNSLGHIKNSKLLIGNKFIYFKSSDSYFSITEKDFLGWKNFQHGSENIFKVFIKNVLYLISFKQ